MYDYTRLIGLIGFIIGPQIGCIGLMGFNGVCRAFC